MASKSAMGRTMIDLRLIGAGVALVTSFGAGWYVQVLIPTIPAAHSDLIPVTVPI